MYEHIKEQVFSMKESWQLLFWQFLHISIWYKAIKKKSEVTQSYPTLCNPMDCRPPGSSVHGILQARILEWVAIPFSRGSFQPRDQTWVSCTAGRFFTIWAIREAHSANFLTQELIQISMNKRNSLEKNAVIKIQNTNG